MHCVGKVAASRLNLESIKLRVHVYCHLDTVSEGVDACKFIVPVETSDVVQPSELRQGIFVVTGRLGLSKLAHYSAFILTGR